jgi:hypothetical protein
MRKIALTLFLAAVIGVLFARYQDGAGATNTLTTASSTPRPVSVEDEAILERAEQVLVARCMARAGFDYEILAPNPDPFPFRYVLDDPNWAARNGYGSKLRRQQQSRKDANNEYFQALTPTEKKAATVAINGPSPVGLTAKLPSGLVIQHSDRGCVAEAQRGLYRDLATWFQSTKVVENLPGARYSRVVSDPRYATAVRSWSLCMRQRGHQVADPAAAHGQFINSAKPFPHKTEVEFATAEADCGITSRLAATARTLDADYDGTLRAGVRPLLLARANLQRQALPAARQIVRSGSVPSDLKPHSPTAVVSQVPDGEKK